MIFKITRIVFLTLFIFFTCQFTKGYAGSSDLIKDVVLVDKVQRSYSLYIPNKPSENARPLIILLHGHGGSADQLFGENGRKAPYKVWKKIADRENLVLVAPDGLIGSSGKMGWNDCRQDAAHNPKSNDVTFINFLIDHVASITKIDQSRIYATGTSNGGHMSIRLALELPQRIKAAAPVVATMPKNNKCNSSGHPVPILFMVGTKDPLSPYLGGIIGKKAKRGRGSVLSGKQTIDWWRKHNKAVKTPIVTAMNDKQPKDGSHVIKSVYPSNGKMGAPVVMYEVNGGGHTEPSIKERYSRIYKLLVGNQNSDIEMADEIWAFFQEQ